VADIGAARAHLEAALESNGLAGGMFTGAQDDLAACITAIEELPSTLAAVLDKINTQRDNALVILAKTNETDEHLQQADYNADLEETRNARVLVEHQSESADIILARLQEAYGSVEGAIAMVEAAKREVEVSNAQANEADRSVGGAAENIAQAIQRLNG
jgi:hypothetical protein